jgi:predicted DsbA family dithiol-disulfide isomerase
MGEQVHVMKRIDGAQPYGVFEKVVENLLNQTP